ncbi:SixA phosphatase family protein [Psychroserpens damuponensis]|uniref:SixA phosphatase family protein n=1 Tax=Psychroserpens damuponensis TaxID=943936 RepID=UPI00058C48A0|nr:histidine phosphatase family protein [Psychroserpens damuponensis]
MKTIILVRHAKSSWKHQVSDRDRPLKKRGNTDASLVSNVFKTKNLQLDGVYSSPANRALLTCKIFMDNLNYDHTKLSIKEDLYDFGGEQVIDFLRSLNENYQNVMIFGHNHAFTSICNIFGNSYIDNLPTSGLVVIDFDVKSWIDINKGNTRFTIFPRDLK